MCRCWIWNIAGYGIYINYKYIKEHGIGNYVKYQNWEGEATGKRPRLFKVDEKRNVKCLNLIYKTTPQPSEKFIVFFGNIKTKIF